MIIKKIFRTASVLQIFKKQNPYLSYQFSKSFPQQLFTQQTQKKNNASQQQSLSKNQQKKFNEKIQSYISSKDLILLNPFAEKSYKKVQVPRFLLSKPQQIQKIQKIFSSNRMQQFNVILHTNPTFYVGMRRIFFEQYLKTNIYKGIQQPFSKVSETNPQKIHSLEQLQFDQQLFFLMDRGISKQMKHGFKYGSDQFYEQLQRQIQNFYGQYQNDIDSLNSTKKDGNTRFLKRLQKQLKIPINFCNILTQAINNECKIHFSGINQFLLRKIISKSISINNLKTLFLESLIYYTSQIKDHTKEYLFNYQDFAKEFIYLNHYNLIQPFEINNIRNFQKILQKEMEQTGNSFNNTVIFAHNYIFDSLKTFPSQKNIIQPQYTTEMKKQNPNELQQRSYQFQKQYKNLNDQQSDLIKIQKNAILEIMLGDLWNQSFIKNKFPYLSQNFLKLAFDDKRQVQGIYVKNLAKYTIIKRNFILNWKKIQQGK